ncbi:hypothetical protein AB0K00_41605 [Dactylosporangium sp. NPDC049525]|uniref:hypothetical protein n=1 Tax=Dactylosporangium sp. NPDC049525 TaxID=3154730 RepID=UPI003426C36F
MSVRRVLRWLRRLVAVVVSLCALVGAVRLVVPATAGPTGEPPGVRRQLAFLRAALDDGAADAAQELYPEGYFFLPALYGLTWVELGQRAPAGDRATALREARWAWQHLDSPAGRAPFSADLSPPYGVFYRGWSNWLLGGLLSLQPVGQRDPGELDRFAADSGALGRAFDESASPYLTAYPGQAWPVDSTVAVASLRLHETLLPPAFTGTVRRWLGGVRERLDPRTGLLPHRVDPETGAPVEVARGLLPIGDAFLAWSKTARPWVAATPSVPPAGIRWWWRMPLLSLLVLLGAVAWLPATVRRHRRRPAAVGGAGGPATVGPGVTVEPTGRKD